MLQPSVSLDRPAYVVAAEQLRGNKGQWRAYESDGNCVVLAGPGSGKTKTLTIKLARMLAEDIRQPRGLACVTYSNECARELMRRLETLGISESRRTFIGTVHGFCLRNIVIPYATLGGISLPTPITVADELQQSASLQAGIASLGMTASESSLRVDLDYYRRTYIDRNSRSWNTDPSLARLVEAYESNLRKNGLIDFDDMTLFGLQLVETHEWIRKVIKARFPVLVVDEYQDLGLPLHRLVLALKASGVRIFAVGDPNQSIYGFTGANPQLLEELANEDDVTRVSLKLNYRCGGKIVETSQVVLQRDMGYSAVSEHESSIEIHACGVGTESQAEYICNELIPEIQSRRPGIRLGDIALLYMDRYDGDILARYVREKGWRFVRSDKGAPYPKTPLNAWLEDCAAWCASGWRTGNPRLSSILSTWARLTGQGQDDSTQRSSKSRVVSFLWSERNPDTPLGKWLRRFADNCLSDYLNSGLASRDKEGFETLVSACLTGADLETFSISDLGGQRGASDHLNLTTLYSAKGLEYDVAILVSMELGKIPREFRPTSKQLEEARRLFYVGLTRARYEVHITYAVERWSKTKGRYYPVTPSPLVREIWDLCT
ncbi:MAG: ATP-dependent helicase [Bacillota bacterium]